MSSPVRLVAHSLAVLGTFLVAYGTAHAQSTRSGAAEDSWRVSPNASVESESDDNAFRLSSNRKDDVASPTAAELASGRFNQMGNARDVIVTLIGGLEASGPGLGGRTLAVKPFVDYERYVWNTRRSNVTLGVSLAQSLPHEGRMRVHASLRPSYFAKNYLADAVDFNADGSIADGERIYAPGEYRESELGFDYRHRLANATQQRPFGAWLDARVGYLDRAFDAPHVGRNLSGPSAGATLRLELSREVEAEGSYDVALLTGAPASQVLLLDEAPFGRDFNRNGRVSDTNVRVLTTVDRSRTVHTVGGAMRFDVGRAKDLTLTYDRRWRSYSSAEPLDVTYNGRRDWRDRFGAELTVRLAREVRLRIGGRFWKQRLNRASDVGGTFEEDDYTKFQAYFGLSFEGQSR